MKHTCTKHGETEFVPAGVGVVICRECLNEAMLGKVPFVKAEDVPVGFERISMSHKVDGEASET